MTIWIIIIALVACTTAIFAFPILRKRSSAQTARHAYDIAVYKDQLAEVDHDLERKLITEVEAESVRFEIRNRVLDAASDVKKTAQSRQSGSAGNSGNPGFVVIALIVIMPILAVALYLKLGSPEIPDYPYAQRGINPDQQSTASSLDGNANSNVTTDMDTVIVRLKERLEQDPADQKGWGLLSRSLMSLGRYGEAAQAYKNLYQLSGSLTDKSDYAEAALAANNSLVTAELLSIFHEITKADPLEPRSRFYIGLEAQQGGNIAAAMQTWVDLLYISPKDAPWITIVQNQINLTASENGFDISTITPSDEAVQMNFDTNIRQTQTIPGLVDEDVEQVLQMSDQEQKELIETMVDQLAINLADYPDDPDGWNRLATSYDVLGYPEKAADARRMAEKYSR